jgi:hypothetical protein
MPSKNNIGVGSTNRHKGKTNATRSVYKNVREYLVEFKYFARIKSSMSPKTDEEAYNHPIWRSDNPESVMTIGTRYEIIESKIDKNSTAAAIETTSLASIW